MRSKLAKFIGLILAFSIISNTASYFTNASLVYAVINSYDMGKIQVIKTKEMPEDYSYLTNNNMLKYVELRDRHNVAWANASEPEAIKIEHGSSKVRYLPFFNYFIVLLRMDTNVVDEKKPVLTSPVQFDRLVVLRKQHSKWYVEKDIFNYHGKLNILNVFDLNYTERQTSHYFNTIYNAK